MALIKLSFQRYNLTSNINSVVVNTYRQHKSWEGGKEKEELLEN